VGLDFSEPAVAAARELATDTELDGDFVAADVYEAAGALGGERFDIVYTGLGAINWLPDLPAWAAVVASLLRDGGFLYLSEFHPFTWVFGDDDLTIEYDYFHDPEGVSFDEEEQGSYADLSAKTSHNATREWAHPLADVLGAVLGAGLGLELYNEHDYTLFPRWPHLEVDRDRPRGEIYCQPEGTPHLPLMFSLRARR
jgi:SAM-dependent methyltransferase